MLYLKHEPFKLTKSVLVLFQVAGNYTIQLTVTDSDGATSSTLAHLVVNEEIDYPPTANAGKYNIGFGHCCVYLQAVRYGLLSQICTFLNCHLMMS